MTCASGGTAAVAGRGMRRPLPQLQLRVCGGERSSGRGARAGTRRRKRGLRSGATSKSSASKWSGVDEEVLRRPVAEDERLARGQQALDLRSTASRRPGSRRRRSDDTDRRGPAPAGSGPRIRRRDRECICREQLAGAPRRARSIRPRGARPSSYAAIRCVAHDEQELLVVVREDRRHRSRWQDRRASARSRAAR